MLPGSLVYESTSQARFIVKVSNRGDMLILPFFFVLGGLMNLQWHLQSFALSSHIHISSGWDFRQACGLWAIGSRFWYVFPMSMIMQLFLLSQKLILVVFLNGHLIVFKHSMEEETI
jgi:hypothetical protein